MGCDENNVRQTSDGVALGFMKPEEKYSKRRSIQRLNSRSVVRFFSETTPFFVSIEGPSNDCDCDCESPDCEYSLGRPE